MLEIPHYMDKERLELKAVIDHKGNDTHKGHYIAKCWNTEMEKWYVYNDQQTKEISKEDLQSSDAYLLIYEATNETRRKSKRGNKSRLQRY